MPAFPIRCAALGALVLALAGCALPTLRPDWPAEPLLIFGEQHDRPLHQWQAARAVEHLAARGRLRAVVIEMAERGRSTDGLAPDASEAEARQALAWTEAGWPWSTYAPVVMAAVRAGVPVVGGNLPRRDLPAAMAAESWEAAVAPAARARIAELVREGHCGLLPARQERPMVRGQIARDASLAEALREQAAPGGVVLALMGAGHASRGHGVPLHLQAGAPALALRVIGFSDNAETGEPLGADEWWPGGRDPGSEDHCAGLRLRLASTAPPAPGASAPAAPR